jgi:hypothetical protein
MDNQIELSRLIASAPVFAPAKAAPPDRCVDPVFSLIESHLRAMRNSTAANEAAEALAGSKRGGGRFS